ncbi:E3 ubiquitin-protein ligase CHIP [Cladobotryum mycophilum]|uniref:E3 ubiquitin-protein ligase CHIP n=1 Tax=Cladobotryum mycophilum TaxID=491253 RepID=A0ABR0S8L2_9HYPO
MSKATALKEEGNRHFTSGDFVGADGLYSKAIIADPKNPALYTNRAMARLKLGYWDSVISDCQTCLGLAPQNMKAHYYLSQAQLSIGDFDNAVTHALEAHTLCAATNDKSLAAVTALVLKCKKDRWDHLEKKRRRENQDLEREVLDLLRRDRDETLMAVGDDDFEKKTVREEAEGKMNMIAKMFEQTRAQSEKRREVPEWAIDDITFGFMVDPVITKTGKSYERAAIMEHLRRHPSDPLTREPLQASDLRPNLGLRQACEDFLEENGWAVDW